MTKKIITATTEVSGRIFQRRTKPSSSPICSLTLDGAFPIVAQIVSFNITYNVVSFFGFFA